MNIAPERMNFKQAMHFCGYKSYVAFRRFVNKHKIPFSSDGKMLFFRKAALLAYFERFEKEAQAFRSTFEILFQLRFIFMAKEIRI